MPQQVRVCVCVFVCVCCCFVCIKSNYLDNLTSCMCIVVVGNWTLHLHRQRTGSSLWEWPSFHILATAPRCASHRDHHVLVECLSPWCHPTGRPQSSCPGPWRGHRLCPPLPASVRDVRPYTRGLRQLHEPTHGRSYRSSPVRESTRWIPFP